ncbi:MAG: nucleotidyltransferase domain-containing protein [Gammaproteobacteria bacterium]|nr:nucleotidyltransferase domain-containing protein [Gammaproteobacteria bacterium]
MLDLDQSELDIVKNILAKHIPQYEVHAFGSRVTNNAKQFSDLDLVIITDKKLPWQKLEAIRDDFSASDLSIMVDIHDWQAISREFRKIIEQKYVIIQMTDDKNCPV